MTASGRIIYTAEAHVTGGRADGHGRTWTAPLRSISEPPSTTLPSVGDADEAVELVRAGDLLCPYSNATSGNIDVSLTANGREVERTPSEQMAQERR
jgi:organic hydroperoxide reductase OsmC/OhrA